MDGCDILAVFKYISPFYAVVKDLLVSFKTGQRLLNAGSVELSSFYSVKTTGLILEKSMEFSKKTSSLIL